MPRMPLVLHLIRVRKGNTLLLNRIYLHYGLPYQDSYSSAGRIEAGLICKRLFIGSATNMRLLPRVLSSISSTKASRTQLPDMPLRRDTQALRFIASIPLSCGEKSVLLVKKKALSRSVFSLSMYVVLKTRYVNLNIHVRRY